nr:hypothetical protein KitaXyl93_13220 [Kitasatospora sp. Xyl93]
MRRDWTYMVPAVDVRHFPGGVAFDDADEAQPGAVLAEPNAEPVVRVGGPVLVRVQKCARVRGGARQDEHVLAHVLGLESGPAAAADVASADEGAGAARSGRLVSSWQGVISTGPVRKPWRAERAVRLAPARRDVLGRSWHAARRCRPVRDESVQLMGGGRGKGAAKRNISYRISGR